MNTWFIAIVLICFCFLSTIFLNAFRGTTGNCIVRNNPVLERVGDEGGFITYWQEIGGDFIIENNDALTLLKVILFDEK